MTEPEEKAIIYLTEDHRVEWKYETTKELLKLYDEKSDMLDSGIITTQKKLWELIAKDLNQKGNNYTPSQCDNKWKTLKRNFKVKQEKIEKFGSCKRSCPFESEISEILSKRPNESIVRGCVRKTYPVKIEPKPDNFINLNIPPGFEPEISKPQAPIKIFQNPAQPVETFVLQQEPSQSLESQLGELKKIVSRNGKVHIALQRKILEHFENAAQRQAQQLDLEETRVAQQNEIIKQMKMQNALLMKLLEKPSSGGNIVIS